MTINIVIVGGSFGGLTAAYQLRRHLRPDQARITLIAKDPRFVFIPPVLSMVLTPLAGVAAVASSPGLANPNSFVPVDARYRHPTPEGVYAVGANEFPEHPSSAPPSSYLRCPPFLGKLTFPALPPVRK